MPVMEGDTSQEAASADTPATTAASDERARPLASFRLPAFAPDEADLWLLQVECAFDVAGIADPVTKFKLLVANLPTNVAAQRLAQSRASRLEALLRHQQLGDRSPSQLLRDMRGQLSTAGDSSVDSGLLRTLFLQRLPQSARAALSLLPEATPLAELAQAADRFLEASRPTGAVSAVGANSSPAPAATTGDGDLAAAIASLSAVISRLDTSHRRLEGAVAGRRSRPGTPRRGSRSSSPSRDEREDYCWYHRTYGARARKCTGPCAWTPAGNSEA
ncbi:uncharacterized protein LOC122388651 [Amphibalanus amphitrite]|uniref:uncharacterized protein LOC122388651 n=1 Tax=Amphibalanus amphitrite TaxID=1232801 RepID=UPI001C927F0B|nr:uncharacterized protein LOC122388651 [Amphibalanus amphitrite]